MKKTEEHNIHIFASDEEIKRAKALASKGCYYCTHPKCKECSIACGKGKFDDAGCKKVDLRNCDMAGMLGVMFYGCNDCLAKIKREITGNEIIERSVGDILRKEVKSIFK